MSQEHGIDTQLEDHAIFQEDSSQVTEAVESQESEWAEGEDGDDEFSSEGDLLEEPEYDEEVPRPAAQGKLWTTLGVLFLGAGVGHGCLIAFAPDAVPALTDALSNLGLSPAHPILAALVLFAFGRQRDSGTLDTTDLQDQLHNQFQDFVANIPSSSPDGAGMEDIDRVLMALQRQDEKINNLTRATKMYGKPMVEITTQVSDTANQLKDLNSAITELQTEVGMIKELKGNLDAMLQESSQASAKATEPLAQQLSEVHDLVKQMPSQRSAELKSLQEELGQSVGGRMDETQKHLAGAVEKLLASNKDSSLTELESTLDSIKGALSGISKDISQLRSMPAASSPAAAPAQAAPAQPAATAAPAAAPVEEAGSKPPPGGLAHSIAGSKKAAGKNVLGAIAKLKNMRQ
ncbi:MAG: hypothetical protein ACYTG5_01790 [Planctomycetota bacterium]|jgi:predicted  nucleic acid-binding Zn-ribbon protein